MTEREIEERKIFLRAQAALLLLEDAKKELDKILRSMQDRGKDNVYP